MDRVTYYKRRVDQIQRNIPTPLSTAEQVIITPEGMVCHGFVDITEAVKMYLRLFRDCPILFQDSPPPQPYQIHVTKP